MKMKILGSGTLFIILMTACNNGSETTTTDSTTVSTGSSRASSADGSASTNIRVQFDPTVSYVDLKTGKPVRLRVDTVTEYIVDEATNEPVLYYINPATNDTFDSRGRLVNSALVRSSSGDYSVDESRITVDDDDNSSMSSDDTDTTSSMTDAEATASGNSKTVIKEDRFKQKTDTTKVKIKPGKVKMKTKANNN